MPTAIVLSVSLAGNALAVSSTISPHAQSHNHGVASQWNLNWSGTGPFDVYFYYDTSDPSLVWFRIDTSTTSKSLSHVYAPCTTRTFHQQLVVYDAYGMAIDTSTATEKGGACFAP